MIAFLKPLMTWPILGAVAALAVIVGAYQYGRASMDAEWQARTLQKSVEMLRERRDTNEAIRNLDDRELCTALGGVPDDATGQCL
jgi:hypothetical protein